MLFDRKCKITYICHGATIYSDEYRFSDAEHYPPLNEAGYEEMEKICEFLKQRGVNNDRIYASPSLRTVQSAELVAKLYKKEFEIIEDLHPKSCGVWNGLTFDQIEEKNHASVEESFLNPDKKLYGEKESWSDFITRVEKSIDKIVADNIGNRIIIVTHPEVIQAAVCSAIGLSHAMVGRIYVRTGSATQISYYDTWASLKYSGCVPV